MNKDAVFTHTHKYYSAVKKEILPFVTTGVGLEDIMLSEISQRKFNILCSQLHAES